MCLLRGLQSVQATFYLCPTCLATAICPCILQHMCRPTRITCFTVCLDLLFQRSWSVSAMDSPATSCPNACFSVCLACHFVVISPEKMTCVETRPSGRAIPQVVSKPHGALEHSPAVQSSSQGMQSKWQRSENGKQLGTRWILDSMNRVVWSLQQRDLPLSSCWHWLVTAAFSPSSLFFFLGGGSQVQIARGGMLCITVVSCAQSGRHARLDIQCGLLEAYAFKAAACKCQNGPSRTEHSL